MDNVNESAVAACEQQLELYKQYHPTEPMENHDQDQERKRNESLVENIRLGKKGKQPKFALILLSWKQMLKIYRNPYLLLPIITLIFVLLALIWRNIRKLIFFLISWRLYTWLHNFSVKSVSFSISSGIRDFLSSLQVTSTAGETMNLKAIECPICLDSIFITGKSDSLTLSCSHSFCSTCVTLWYGQLVRQGLCHFKCCMEDCCSPVDSSTVSHFLPPILQTRLRYNLFLQAVVALPEADRFPCGAADCPGFFVRNFADDFFVSCPACVTLGRTSSFCFKCAAPHSREEHTRMSRNVSYQARKLFSKLRGCRESTRLTVAESVVRQLGLPAHKCPRCKKFFGKDEGCNHVTCWGCGLEFHWAKEISWAEHKRKNGTALWS